jgi:hypothetical protein
LLRFRLLVEQGQERVLKRLHLALSLGTIAGRVWGEQGTQAGHLRREPVILASKVGVLGRKPLVLSRESGHLLLRNPRLSLGFVPLLLAKLHSVLPEARGSGFGSVVHGSGFISIGALRPKHYEATTTTQPCGL